MRTLLASIVLALLVASGAAHAAGVPAFKKVVIVVLENTTYADAIKQPFMAKLAKEGANLTKMNAIHGGKSQPNYFAMTAGDTFGITSNSPYDLDVTHLADLLEERGKTWKVYAEGFPGNCFQGEKRGAYVRKHNPFISYVNIQKNSLRCANIVDAGRFALDAKANVLPDFSLYIPDNNNNGHDTDVKFADRFVEKTFGPFLADGNRMAETLFILTYDEGNKYVDPLHIYTAFYGAGVKAGTQSSMAYDLYGLLRTLEVGFGLKSLGRNDTRARVIDDIWQ